MAGNAARHANPAARPSAKARGCELAGLQPEANRTTPAVCRLVGFRRLGRAVGRTRRHSRCQPAGHYVCRWRPGWPAGIRPATRTSYNSPDTWMKPTRCSTRIMSSSAAPCFAARRGPPQNINLLDQRDLDNYLLPLATRLSQHTHAALACVWGTKQHADSSFARIEQANPAPTAPAFDCCYTVRTTASSQSAIFKEQIRDQLAEATPLPPGPVRIQISFTVGPRRNWLTCGSRLSMPSA